MVEGRSASPNPQTQIEDLQSILKVSRQLAASTDLPRLLKAIEESVLKVLDCERATVFLHDAKTDELYSRFGTGIEEIRFPARLGIAGQSFRTASAINILDAYADPRFNPEIDKQTGFRTRNLLTFPLTGLEDQPIGVLQVLNKRGGAFTRWDVSLVQDYGAQAGVALQRQLLLDEFAEKQRLERDLDIARQIQAGILPKEPPRVPGLDLVGWSRPATETGGDFFDFQTLPGGRVLVTLGDVTGHGVGPALVAAMCQSMTRALVSLTDDVGQIVDRVNKLLCQDLPSDRMVTGFVGIVDPAHGKLRYLSAGQGPLLAISGATGLVRRLPTQGPPLGIDSDFDFGAPEECGLERGDLLVLTTDGFFEWADAREEAYGIDRLGTLCSENRAKPTAEILAMLVAGVERFAGGTPQLDDLTAILLKRS